VIVMIAGQSLPSGAIVAIWQVGNVVRAIAPSGGSENNSSSVPIGVLLEDAVIGQPVKVAVSGICSIMMGIYPNQPVVPAPTSPVSRTIQGSGALVVSGRQYNNLFVTWYGACDLTGTSPSNAGKVGVVIIPSSIANVARDITLTDPACALVMLQTGYEAN
jgi:hypothetical protein